MQKKFILLFLAVFLISLTFAAGCSDEDSSPTAAAIPKDLTQAEVSTILNTSSGGGDPRGTYYINTPFFTMFTSDTSRHLQFKTVTQNSGSGTIKFEGSSSLQGTWTSTNITVAINLVFSITTNGRTEDITMAPSAADLQLNGSSTGTWKVIDSEKLIMTDNKIAEPVDTVEFLANSKGLFLGSEIDTDVFGVMIIKK